LLEVVETNDDRRVCLENILAINPNNELAARQLHTFNVITAQRRRSNGLAQPPRKRRFGPILFMVKFLLMLIGAIVLLLIGLLISVAIQNGVL